MKQEVEDGEGIRGRGEGEDDGEGGRWAHLEALRDSTLLSLLLLVPSGVCVCAVVMGFAWCLSAGQVQMGKDGNGQQSAGEHGLRLWV